MSTAPNKVFCSMVALPPMQKFGRYLQLMRCRLINKAIRLPITWFCAIICLFCMLDRSFALAESPGASSGGPVTDFVVFWAPARLLLNSGNPFSPVEVFELQREVGYSDSKPDLMWHPPWTLSFVLPFGVMDFSTSHFFWLVLHIFLILLCARKLWVIYGLSGQNPYLPWIVTLTLVPAWFVLVIGQISPLVLLGFVGFLYFQRMNRLFLAGMSIAPVTVKPHLIYLFWIGLLLWIVRERRWQVAAGAIVAVLMVAAIPAIIDPAVYSQFLDMYRFPGRSRPFEFPAPSMGRLLTLYLPHGNVPIQFLPIAAGALWFWWYWQRHKENWDWSEQLPIVILVSLTLSAYAWTYDQVLLLPAVMQGLGILSRQNLSWYKNPGVLLYCGINVIYFVSKIYVPTDIYYFWLAPAFLLTYLAVVAFSSRSISATSDRVVT